MITPLRVFGLTLMFMLVSPVWAAPTAPIERAVPCGPNGCTPPKTMAMAFRQPVNCICIGKTTRVFLVANRPGPRDLLPGEKVIPLKLNSRILGSGVQYLITTDAGLAAQLGRDFMVDGVKSFRDQTTITISLLR